MNADGTPIVPEGATPPTPAVNGTGGGTTLPTEDGIGVSKKRKVRGGHRAHLTKMLTEVTTQLTGYTEQREAKVLTLKSCLERKADVLSKLDADILEEMDDGGQMGMEIDQAEALQSQITEAIIKIDKAIKTAAKPESKPDVKPALSGDKRQTMKLPKYQVEDFHGDPKKWRSFKESFDVAVTNNPELSDVQMFHYLRGYLKGEARLAIEGLPVTADNFSEAVQLLEQRFGNKQVIVNSHMEELTDMKEVDDKDDTKGLRALHDKVEKNLRSLRSLGVNPDHYGSLLVPMLKNRFLQ